MRAFVSTVEQSITTFTLRVPITTVTQTETPYKSVAVRTTVACRRTTHGAQRIWMNYPFPAQASRAADILLKMMRNNTGIKYTNKGRKITKRGMSIERPPAIVHLQTITQSAHISTPSGSTSRITPNARISSIRHRMTQSNSLSHSRNERSSLSMCRDEH